MSDEGKIVIRKARVNNLKNIDVEIPRGKFVVITGISGSGKSSLAFDTLFAEGQRRFAESLSSYARQFLGRMSKPDVDLIEGIPPAIAIEQKVNTRNPRSTVATSTEIYDYLRIIFSRIGRTYSPVSGQEVRCQSQNDVSQYVKSLPAGGTAYILADLDWKQRTDRVELMLSLKEEGFSRFFTDRPVKIEEIMRMADSGDYPEELYLLVDRIRLTDRAGMSEAEAGDFDTRLYSSIHTAFDKGRGVMFVRTEISPSGNGIAAPTPGTASAGEAAAPASGTASAPGTASAGKAAASRAASTPGTASAGEAAASRAASGTASALASPSGAASAGEAAASRAASASGTASALASTSGAASAGGAAAQASGTASASDTAASRVVSAGEVLKEGGVVMERFSDRMEADGMTFRKPDEYMFSFNSPLGACPVCGGLGKIIGISEELVVPDQSKSIYEGAIACWRGEKMGWFKEQLIRNADRYSIPIFEPWHNLTRSQRAIIWEGRRGPTEDESIIGLNEFFRWVESNKYKIQYKYMLSRYSGRTTCRSCGGSRLRPDALYVKVGGRNIQELLSMNVEQLYDFLDNVALTPYESKIVEKARREVMTRLQYIKDVGLSYLTLDRASNTLSGGESQRINLVTALGSSLVGSLYILDEPSIGLHPRDTERLIGVLKRLRDIGNTVVVVEHDEEIMRAADLLIDIGPKAGVEGGQIVFQGTIGAEGFAGVEAEGPAGVEAEGAAGGEVTPSAGENGSVESEGAARGETEGTGGEVAVGLSPETVQRSLTLQYLMGTRQKYIREKHGWKYSVTVEGAMEHNLKDVDVRFPLGSLVVVTGVSGSGKSSLVGDILYPALYRHINQTGQAPGTFRGLSGNLDRVAAVEYVDQNPIGKSSRSNAVTYLKVYDDIRKLLADQQYAKLNGYTPSFFSFNMDGGRCPECQGDGFVKIGMQFMADVTMTCEACGGKRFKPDILEVRYKGKNIDDILNMSVEEAIAFFASQKEAPAQRIAERLQPLVDVGLSYIKLGQSSSTLSGGESQRIKLAYFLSVNDVQSRSGGRNSIMFIFDEPTTGLHFYDVEKLLKSFDALISKGHSIVVVEHNPDVIRAADWVIDLGPDAGDAGGRVVFEGTPEDMIAHSDTFTARYIR